MRVDLTPLEKSFRESVETTVALKKVCALLFLSFLPPAFADVHETNTQELPKLVDKMKRTATVMQDLPRMDQHPTEQLLQEAGKSKKAKTTTTTQTHTKTPPKSSLSQSNTATTAASPSSASRSTRDRKSRS